MLDHVMFTLDRIKHGCYVGSASFGYHHKLHTKLKVCAGEKKHLLSITSPLFKGTATFNKKRRKIFFRLNGIGSIGKVKCTLKLTHKKPIFKIVKPKPVLKKIKGF